MKELETRTGMKYRKNKAFAMLLKFAERRGLVEVEEAGEGIEEGDKILITGDEILKIRPSSEEAIGELHKKLEAID